MGQLSASIRCVRCGAPYPEAGAPYCCTFCGGVFDYLEFPAFKPARVDASQPGIWRYRHVFGLEARTEPLSIGEGRTPLLWSTVSGRRVAFKCEYANPTGSFKDRGMSVLLAALRARDVLSAVEDSSGNAGASFAAYAARAGMRARVYVPAAASGLKRRQIAVYGAQIVPVLGPRAAATAAALQAAAEGAAYASHAWLPFNLPGYATAAFELVEQMDVEPGAVILPAGQGGLLLGMARGFHALVSAGLLRRAPAIIGVQAAACAPLLASSLGQEAVLNESETIAEGVRVGDPVRRAAVVRAVHDSGGRFVAATEAEIAAGRDQLAGRGFYVEPTSALVWCALEKMLPKLSDPVVAVLTGSGYKVL